MFGVPPCRAGNPQFAQFHEPLSRMVFGCFWHWEKEVSCWWGFFLTRFAMIGSTEVCCTVGFLLVYFDNGAQKIVKPSPKLPYIDRWYIRPFPVMGGLWHCFTHINHPSITVINHESSNNHPRNMIHFFSAVCLQHPRGTLFFFFFAKRWRP